MNRAPHIKDWLKKEFISYVPEEITKPSRRGFLTLMGASAALAGMTGCRWPREEILPYARRPDNRTPGEPVKFGTSFNFNGFGIPTLATSLDGRPIKLDGNDLHPMSRGRSHPWLQASVLSLYDPDRSHGPARHDRGASQPTAHASESHSGGGGHGRPATGARPLTWNDFVAAIRPEIDGLRAAGGTGLVVLARPCESMTIDDVRKRLLEQMPQAVWTEWAPTARDNLTQGLRSATGQDVRPHLQLAEADVIVSIDDDFLYHHPASLHNAAGFAAGRRPREGKVSRLHVVEAGLTLTGSLADVRTPLRPSQLPAFLARLAAELARGGAAGGFGLGDAGENTALDERLARSAAQIAWDLLGARQRCVITAGAHLPPEVHALVAAMNGSLFAVGHTLTYTEAPRGPSGTMLDGIRRATEVLRGGQCRLLLILGGNPVYDAPADLAFADALAEAPLSVHLSEYDDETSHACTWHVNQAHSLESWGDLRSYDGTVSIVQPLIEPLYNGKTPTEVLALLLRDTPQSAYELTRAALRDAVLRVPRELGALAPPGAADFDVAWNRALHSGFVAGTQLAPVEPRAVAGTNWDAAAFPKPTSGDAFEVVFRPDYSVGCGESANNAWLQELPDPLTKLTWDNAAWLAPADAQRLGVTRGDRITLKREGGELVLPVFVLPGHAQGVITILLGYGRKLGGAVAEVAGFNAFPFRRSDGLAFAGDVQVTRTAGDYLLATTQDHWMMDTQVSRDEYKDRLPELFREISVEEANGTAKATVGGAVHLPLAMKSLWEDPKYDGHRWAMAVDLSTCIACNACIVACQAENNIPVVGKEEVEMGRSMHWMRIDRYFRGDPADPGNIQFAHQPVTCHQCEMAPCESVCPVNATVHDDDGINVMVYNRCIGTRYCSNNCPYKVRRFNWFYNHHGPKHPRSVKHGSIGFPKWEQPALLKQELIDPIERMVHNPEVTVRSRGVMEKCNFCLQRIARAKIDAKNRWLKLDEDKRGERYQIPDGTIRTACQEACPTDTLVFGDLADPESKVSKLFQSDRGYFLLEALYTKPRLKYLARVANRGGPAGHGEGHGHEAHTKGHAHADGSDGHDGHEDGHH